MRSAYPLHRLPHSTVLSALVTMYPCRVLTTPDLPKAPGNVPVCLSGGSLWNPDGHQPLHPPLPSATKGWKACPFTETEGTALFIPLTHTLIHTFTPSLIPSLTPLYHSYLTHTLITPSLTPSLTPSSHPHSHPHTHTLTYTLPHILALTPSLTLLHAYTPCLLLQQPSWRPMVHKGSSRLQLAVQEEIKAVQYDKQEVADVWEVYGTVHCKV